jgi:hypothetical protein
MIFLRLRETLHFFWQHLTELLWRLLPVLPLLLLSSYRFEVVSGGDVNKAATDVVSMGLDMLAGVAATTLTIGYAFAVLRDQDRSLTALWRRALPAVPALIAVQVLTGFAVLAGLLLFILPGIYLIGALMPAYVLTVHEGLLPLPALKASWQRFRGQAWAVSASVCLLMLGLMVVLSGLGTLDQLLDDYALPQAVRIGGGALLDLVGVLFMQLLAILLVRFYELEPREPAAG